MENIEQKLTQEEQKMLEEFMDKLGSDSWTDLLSKEGGKYIPILEKVLSYKLQ